MGYITEWLTTIILLILFATVLELMIPNSAMQRYVKMVVGLMLLVVMLQPILSIFQEDVDSWLFALTTEETNRAEQNVTNSINLQKREIELGQRAYISEQVAVQLESQVAEMLEEEHHVNIAQVEVELAEDADANEPFMEQQIKAVHVEVQELEREDELEPSDAVDAVEVVRIDTSLSVDDQTSSRTDELSDIVPLLSEYWDIPEEMISIAWEGGKRAE
ncbi:stage III sporulation protein AF [Alkalihalobacillus oceani]|uniref:stage III sporulation protein AF n=1 Tax=Halalkalibacter oceani TaxID=1653776 RepID=UPI002040FE42|nr:stage III sporulation protein AF [Halalkalibacter oceani]MCM3762746.1 stage III sporulation protein AF [Halalkalibacter oceani]